MSSNPLMMGYECDGDLLLAGAALASVRPLRGACGCKLQAVGSDLTGLAAQFQ